MNETENSSAERYRETAEEIRLVAQRTRSPEIRIELFEPPRSAKVLGGHANEHGISANTRFEVCIAKDYPETGFDRAAFFDCLFTTWATRPARRRM